jgi:hypothetical protein
VKKISKTFLLPDLYLSLKTFFLVCEFERLSSKQHLLILGSVNQAGFTGDYQERKMTPLILGPAYMYQALQKWFLKLILKLINAVRQPLIG